MRLIIVAILAIFSLQITYTQECNELFFSEYTEGTGNNKALEIYNPTDDIIDLSKYYVAQYLNGYDGYEEGGITQLQGFLLPYSTHVLVNGQTNSSTHSPACDPGLQILANQLDHDYPAPTYMSGYDAIALLKTEEGLSQQAVMVDLIGQIGSGMNDSKHPGWTINRTLIRKSSIRQGVRQNPELFDISQEWALVPGGSDIWDSLGYHSCSCSPASSVNDFTSSVQMKVFPNPVHNGNIMIYSIYEIEAVEIYNITGHLVYQKQKMYNRGSAIINLNKQPPGIYILRALFTNKHSDHRKILVQ